MRAVVGVVVGVVTGACSSTSEPRLLAFEPPAASTLVDTRAILRGENLLADALVSLDDEGPAKIDRTWRVRAGEIALEGVSWSDPLRLDAVVPRGMAPGTYDVIAIAPGGVELVLPRALTVTGEPIGLALAIEDAPDGAGGSVGGAMTAGDTLSAFAVVRDGEGTFVANVDVDWAVTSNLGTLGAGPSTSTTFTATKVGTGRLIAARAAAALVAETEDLVISAGPVTQLAIEDAPAGQGQPIGDLAGLTTDTTGGLSAFATGRDAFGNFTSDLDVTWSLTGVSGSLPATPTSSVAIDFVTTGVGVLHGTAAVGSAQTGNLTVGGGRAAQLAIVPATLSISADAPPVTFAATATDADGNATTDLGALTWSVASGPISTLAASGVLDPQRAGTGTIVVDSTYGPSATSGSVTVAPGAPAAIAIAPAMLMINADDAPVTFSATGTDADGNATGLGTLTWSIASGPITSIAASTGVFDPARAGTGSIRATSSLGMNQTAPVIVVPGQAAVLTVAPATVDVVEGQLPIGFSASGADADANPTTDLGMITWSKTGTFGAFDAAGTLTPTTPGTGAVRATSSYGSFVDSGIVRVRRAATLAATLAAPATLDLGSTATVTLTLINTGESDATNVLPCTLSSISSGGTVQITAGPTPVSTAIAAGASAQLTWTVSGQTEGVVQLSSCASGEDVTTGAVTMSPGASASIDVRAPIEARVVGLDPFGDGSKFGFVCGYRGEVVVGPNATGDAAVAFAPDGTGLRSLAFSVMADTDGNSSANSSGGPYTSLGYTGCAANLTCGPNNENARGTFSSVTIAGTEWLVAATARNGSGGYIYMTPDNDAVLDFRYVDLSQLLVGASLGFTAIVAVNDVLYIGGAANNGARPRLLALRTMPGLPGIDATTADATDLRVSSMPGIQAAPVDKIDALGELSGRLYLANDGAWARATVAVPAAYSATPTDWAIITPSAAAYTGKSSRTSNKGSDLEPADRAVPQMASFGGRMFVGRNTTTGPQLWACNPATSGDLAQCDAADWSLIARNSPTCSLFGCAGDTLLSQFDDGSLGSIAMVTATPTHLYVGYDSPNGAVVFRTANAAATAQADFEGTAGCSAALHGSNGCDGYGDAGFGIAGTTRIFDGKALTFSASSSVWITAGSSTTPIALVELP